METRGQYIKDLDFQRVKDVDDEINKMIKEKYKNLTEPVCAFITFESTEAKTEAVAYSKEMRKGKRDNSQKIEYGQETILNKVPKFVTASDPTNIIWENRQIKGFTFCCRMSTAIVIISVLLICSCLFMLFLKNASLKMVMKYPSVDCQALFQIFG